jgi:Arc/MetJ-type ribon-helix-helix transcriptional regulator
MMTSVNVSMPEAMKEFIEVAGAEGQYSTRSEFVRELVREFQHRHAETAGPAHERAAHEEAHQGCSRAGSS